MTGKNIRGGFPQISQIGADFYDFLRKSAISAGCLFKSDHWLIDTAGVPA